MEIFQITFQEYCAIMTRVKNEIDMIINITPDHNRKMISINVSAEIERTIATAQAGINLPSAELLHITSETISLETCGATPIPEVEAALTRCYTMLLQAAEVLHRITDDSYVSEAKVALENELSNR